MTKQTIVFTVLPNGFNQTGDHLRLSVFISPRLIPTTSNTLGPEFPDFLDWPTTVNRIKFQVQFLSSPLLDATLISTTSSSVWRNLFTNSTYVEGYQFDSYANLNIRSYPSRNVHAFIQDQYTKIALATPGTPPVNFPTIDILLEDGFGKIGFWRPRVQDTNPLPPLGARINESEVIKQINSLLTSSRAAPTAPNGRGAIQSQGAYANDPHRLQMDFEQTKLFFAPLVPPSQRIHSLTVPTIDFHRIVSSLGQYPQLMRTVGLVCDLEIPVTPAQKSAIAAITSSNMKVRLVIQNPGIFKTTTEVITPWTWFDFSATAPLSFLAKARPNSDLSQGMLLLNNGSFDVMQVDLDGIALKALDYANNLLRLKYGPASISQPLAMLTTDSPTSLSLPSLRSGGITITKIDRAFNLAQVLNNAEQQNNAASSNNSVFYADDLIRGYRLDVWNAQDDSSPPRWLSLSYREATYKDKNGSNIPYQTIPAEDEGWVSLGATQDPTNKNPDLYLHEAVFRWAGWSLCAPRDAKRVDNEDNLGDYDSQEALTLSNSQWAKKGLPALNLAVSFLAKAGSLPRLRFGNTYRFRARAVDMAGNSLGLTDSSIASISKPWVTEPISYGRFEPVPAPTVVLRQPLNPALPEPTGSQDSPAESLNTLVIRSNPYQGKNAADYATWLHGQVSENNLFQDYSYRYIAPPRTSQLMAELHGMFDDPATRQFTASNLLYNDISSRDGWNFEMYPPGNPSPSAPRYPINKTGDTNVHYLPDPFAHGAALLILLPNGELLKIPNVPNSLVRVPFYPNGMVWPNAELFTFQLKEDSTIHFDIPSAPDDQVALDSQTLTAYMPPAAVLKVRLSSYLGPKALPPPAPPSNPHTIPQIMGILQWMAAKSLGKLMILRGLAESGQFWMITPYREHTLIHAVQQPIEAPSFSGKIQVSRNYGDTFATLKGNINFNSDSTGKLNVLAAWDEVIDDPITNPSGPQDGKAWDGKNVQSALLRMAHVFDITQIDRGLSSISFKSSKISPAPGIFPLPGPQRHEFGDTKFRKVRYTVIATTRFLEYFPDKLVTQWKSTPELDDNGIPSAIVRYADDKPKNKEWTSISILSSARPSKPKVLYAVPTFDWTRQGARKDLMISSKRFGGGLRIYMDRPWYSSGDDELIGVVIWPSNALVPPDELNLLVTQWGLDPLWLTNPLSAPKLSNFKNTSKTKTNVSLSELADNDPDRLVNVAGFDVFFNTDRNLWYSDIIIDSGAVYYPFIRLALVRYQPNSIQNAEISPVVLADFAQITPDRSATIVQTGPTKLHVSLTGVFPQPPISAETGFNETPTKVQVLLQQRQQPNITDDDLGYTLVPNSSIFLTKTVTTGPVQRFEGDITLPAPRGSADFRLVIAEYEQFATDNGPEPGQEQPPPFPDYDPILQPLLGLRLVYSEVLKI